MVVWKGFFVGQLEEENEGSGEGIFGFEVDRAEVEKTILKHSDSQFISVYFEEGSPVSLQLDFLFEISDGVQIVRLGLVNGEVSVEQNSPVGSGIGRHVAHPESGELLGEKRTHFQMADISHESRNRVEVVIVFHRSNYQ